MMRDYILHVVLLHRIKYFSSHYPMSLKKCLCVCMHVCTHACVYVMCVCIDRCLTMIMLYVCRV